MPPVFLPAVEIELDPTELGPQFRKLFEERDTTDLHRDIGEHLVNSTDERFEQQKSPDGAPWAPLSPATLISAYQRKRKANRAFKRGRGGTREETAGFARFKANKKILQDKGIRGGLRGSINYRAEDGSVAIGANKIYAAAHQRGLGQRSSLNKRGFGKLPARPFVGVSDEDQTVITGIVRRWIKDEIEG